MNNNNINDIFIFEYLPKDLEDNFSEEFLKVKNEILEEVENSNILNQSNFVIKNIIIQMTKNLHLGRDTYSCNISVVSDSPNSDFVYTEESKDYLANLRTAVKALIHFVRQKNQKNNDNLINTNSF